MCAEESRTIRSTCRSCGKVPCGVLVHLEEGKVRRIEGDPDAPANRGRVCAKAHAATQILYHPDRLKYPMKRIGKRGEGKWKRITWDEALDTIAERLTQIKDKYGAESVVGLHGTGRFNSHIISRFLKAFGSPNLTLPFNICMGPRFLVSGLNAMPYSVFPDLHGKPRCVVQWGNQGELSNYWFSGPMLVDSLMEAEKTILVDPRCTPMAKNADIWLPVRPGTDGALLLSWVNVILEENLFDREFVSKWTNAPFLVCEKKPRIEPETFTWNDYPLPLQITTKLLRESDLKVGGDPQKFMVWDSSVNAIKGAEDPGGAPALLGNFLVTLADGSQVHVKPVLQVYADRAREYTPEKVEAITWVPADKIREAARTYATVKPSALNYTVGTEQCVDSVQNIRALHILTALTGNFEVPGGNGSYVPPPLVPLDILPPPTHDQIKKIIGLDKYPVLQILPYVAPLLYADINSVFRAMHTGKPYPVKALINVTGNFGAVANPRYNYEGIKKLDFIVVHDLWMTPTAEVADIILPAVTWLEADFPRHYFNNVGATVNVVPPVHEGWQEIKLFCELSKRMGLDDFGFQTPEEYHDGEVEPTGMTYEEFKDRFQKEGWLNVPQVYKKHEKGMVRPDGQPGFITPTKRYEIHSTILESLHPHLPGCELPWFTEPPESPYSSPELAKEYPLILITGARIAVFFHTEHIQIPWCREIMPFPRVDINPETAKELGVHGGDWVWIETPRGKVKQRARLTAEVHPKVVSAQHGWWFPERPGPEHGCFESNINVLCDEQVTDPFFGANVHRGLLCRITKVNGEEK